jgi:3-oxoacyl-[acyl-carrier protein] reductase
MELGLKGLKVVVTGSTSGIGKAIAMSMAREGADVAICSRRQEKVNETLAELAQYPGKIIGGAADITDQLGFQQWLNGVADELGGIDIFVANVSPMSDKWEKTVNTDILSTVSSIDAVLPWVKRSNAGSIIYISSMAGVIGTPALPSYGAAKAAMTHYMKTLAMSLFKEGVRVNTVSPGDIIFDGGRWDNLRIDDPDAFKHVQKRNPRGSLGTPDEIAKVVTFLSSPMASLVNGAHLIVDGGSTGHVHF